MFPFWHRTQTHLKCDGRYFQKCWWQYNLNFFGHQWKLVWHPSIGWQLGSKAQSRKHLVTVVVLDDLPDSLQGHGVGIQLVGVHVVQRSGLRGVTCQVEMSWCVYRWELLILRFSHHKRKSIHKPWEEKPLWEYERPWAFRRLVNTCDLFKYHNKYIVTHHDVFSIDGSAGMFWMCFRKVVGALWTFPLDSGEIC